MSLSNVSFKNQNGIGSKLYEAYQASNIVGECPVCGGKLIKRYSHKTKSSFVGCSNYPDCTTVYSIPKGTNFLKKKCDKCGLPIISFGKPRQRACLDANCGKDKTKTHDPKVVGSCPDCGKEIKVFGESHIDEVAAKYGLKVLGKIPMDPQIASLCDRGIIEMFDGDWLEGAADAVEAAQR